MRQGATGKGGREAREGWNISGFALRSFRYVSKLLLRRQLRGGAGAVGNFLLLPDSAQRFLPLARIAKRLGSLGRPINAHRYENVCRDIGAYPISIAPAPGE